MDTLVLFKADANKTSSFGNWDFVRRCAKAVTSTGNIDVLKVVVNIFCSESPKPSEIGEIFALETISAGRPILVVGLLQHWALSRTTYVSYYVYYMYLSNRCLKCKKNVSHTLFISIYMVI